MGPLIILSGKRWRWLLLFFCCGLCGEVFARDSLVLATIPFRHEATLQEQFHPLAQLLRRKLAKAVVVEVAASYDEIGERLHHRVADLGILGPKSYVEAKEKYPGIIYLATNKNPDGFYHSLIIARQDSSLQSLNDLRGKSFAYTETGSTSGYLYPRNILQKSGLDPDRLFSVAYFLNTHDKVYDAVAKGTVHAGAVSSSSYQDAVARNRESYKILATSDPIPRNAVVAGDHLSPQLVETIREILRTAENDSVYMSDNAASQGFLIKDDAFYDIIRHEREMR